MGVSHSYISNDFAFLMKKELTLRKQFSEYVKTHKKRFKVTYLICQRKDLIFKLTIKILDGNK